MNNDLYGRTDEELRHELRRLWRAQLSSSLSPVEELQLKARADAVRQVLASRGSLAGRCLESFDDCEGHVSLLCDEEAGHQEGVKAMHYDSFMGVAWT